MAPIKSHEDGEKCRCLRAVHVSVIDYVCQRKGEGRNEGYGWTCHPQSQGALGDDLVLGKDDDFSSVRWSLKCLWVS